MGQGGANIDVEYSCPMTGVDGPVAVGNVLCPNVGRTGYVVATDAAIAVGPFLAEGIALDAWSDPQRGAVRMQTSGRVDKSVTKLGPGTMSWVRRSSTGWLERAVFDNTSDWIGRCDVDGNMVIDRIVGATISIANTAYLTQSVWYIDPVAGNDTHDGLTLGTAIKTGDELARRWGNAAQLVPAAGTTTVYVTGDVTFTNGVSVNSAYPLVWTSTAATSQGTGTVASVVAASGSTPWSFTDATKTWATHIGRRVRITSGVNVGQVAWVHKDLGANQVRITHPSATNVPPLASAGDLTVTPGAFSNADPYIIETMPQITFGGSASFRGGGGVSFVDLHIAGGTFLGTDSFAYYYRCRFVDYFAPVNTDGGIHYLLNCGADAGVASNPGGQIVVYAGGSTAIHEVLAYGTAGGSLTLDYRCQAQAAAIGAYAGTAATVWLGSARAYDAFAHAVTNPNGAGLVVRAGTTCNYAAAGVGADTPLMAGSGHTGPGAWVEPGGQIFYPSGTATPTLTGATGQLQIDTAVTTWGAAPQLYMTDHGTSGQVLTTTTAGGQPIRAWAQIADANVSASAAVAVSKLAAGTNGQVLTTAGGVPTWAQIANANVSASAAIAVSKLAAGSDNFVLTSFGGVVGWASNAATVAWANDLASSNNTHQYVSSLSGASGLGGAVTLNTSALTWAANPGGMNINAANQTTNSVNGLTLNIAAQTSTGTGTTGGELRLSSGSGTSANGAINIDVPFGGTRVLSFPGAATSVLLGVALEQFGAGLGDVTINQASRALNDGTVSALNVQAQNNTGTGAAVGGALNLTSGTGNGATRAGSVNLQTGGVTGFTVDPSLITAALAVNISGSNYLAFGSTGSVAQAGNIRAQNNTTVIAARNAANSNNLTLVSTDASNNAFFGDQTVVAAARLWGSSSSGCVAGANSDYVLATASGGIDMFTAGATQMHIGSSIALFGTGSFGGGVGVVFFANRTTAPTSNPTGGGVLYAEGGALKYRGSAGTVTTIAPP